MSSGTTYHAAQNKRDMEKKAIEDKAKELVAKFYKFSSSNLGKDDLVVHRKLNSAKACAIICVDEMIKIQEDFYGLVLTPEFRDRVRKRVETLEQVKETIQKL